MWLQSRVIADVRVTRKKGTARKHVLDRMMGVISINTDSGSTHGYKVATKQRSDVKRNSEDSSW